MNEELARKAKQYAARSGSSFTELVEDAITEFVSRAPESARTRKRITFPVSGDPKNRITEAQYRAMVEEMYDEEARRIMRGMRGSRDSS